MADDRRSSRAATQLKETRMELFTEDNATQVVQQRNAACKDPRTRRILDVVTAHLHAIVRELEPTRAEWEQAIAFLTRTGQMCSEARQEFILLSDTLGVSMLVDAIANQAGHGVTESTVLGPFYAGPQRELNKGDTILLREENGAPLVMKGRIANESGVSIVGAKVEVWQTAINQLYDVQDHDQPRGHLR